MDKELLNALYTFYEGNIAKAQANLIVYLDNPAGIGEHPDVIEAMDSQVSIIVENQDKRDAVQLLLENIK
tara:strand:+ start:1398 stop:1607 length:210 start_codon:yes stop_codon:yes gene_type:complete